jgi:long-subunit fatty acid transport protein
MKKKLLIFVSLFLVAQLGFSGGIVTNTNQSTAWTRMLTRDASTSIDAVYFNPAGLMKLNDGFHFSINNQSLWQTYTITNTYPYLNEGTYEGKVTAPLFPGVYAAWKKGRVAVSFGFNPIGGGGSATFDKGLPSMEIGVSSLVPAMQGAFGQLGYGTPTGYSLDMNFEGTSVYFGLQLGVSFEINDNISVFAGGRYIIAKNTYNGYMRNIKIQTEGGAYGDDLPAASTMGDISTTFSNISAAAQGGGDAMQPILDNGGGDYTFAQLEGAGYITSEERAQMEGGLLQFGIPQEQIDAMSAAQAQGAYYQTSQVMAGRSASFAGLSVILTDQDADVTQTGNGFTPIIGANLSFMEDRLNIGLKYEFKTNMDLTTSVANNKGFINDIDPNTGQPLYMFNEGEKVNADIPAMLSVGVQYKIIDPLSIQLGYHTYFDKAAGWATDEDGTELIDKNFSEYAIGLEYNITDKFLVSAGYLAAITGVNEKYQSDLSYSLSTNTFGGGFAYKINDKFTAQIGAFSTSYKDQTVDYTHSFDSSTGVQTVPYSNTYDKKTFAFSLGIDVSL